MKAIDAGHGVGDRNGAQGPSGLLERDVVLDISKRVRDLLVSQGDEVYLTRPNKNHVLLKDRVRRANNKKAEIFVSIHCNAFNGKVSGIETLYYPGSKNGQRLASLTQKELTKMLPTSNDRGLKERKNLYVLKHTKMPAILIELEFIDSMEDLFKNECVLQRFAVAIVRAINKY